MPLNYNLSKVYELSDNDNEFAVTIVSLFLDEVPAEVKMIKAGIENKDYQQVYQAAHKIKPTLDLLCMYLAYEANLKIMNWTKAEGQKKEIIEVYKELKQFVDDTAKEIKKDFNL
ncbi:histidine kinase [Flavobacterium agricola]|uniref:Histidine kinase n=1 Tax=Flavobacterium agricola TaxID=2870839 RepID=A0ABY6LZ00_9FLAO|nr:histidine kinase [Flavobacterium agricola]UYW01511.1 histidine kinase [Flavobacterium agricola]